MGKLNGKGPMGFSGKVGGLVAYNLKGQDVIRQVGYSNKPVTDNQKAQWERMKLTNEFLKPLKFFVQAGFALAVKGTLKSEYNEAVYYTSMAIEGDYPNAWLNYSKAILSKGDLENPENLQLDFLNNIVQIKWINNNADGNRDLDRALLAFYFPQLKSAIIYLTGPERKDCLATLKLPPSHLSQRMIVYIAFQSDDKKKISQSVYLGDHITPGD